MPRGVYPRRKAKAVRVVRRRGPPTGRAAALIHLNRAWGLIMQEVRAGADLRESDMEVRFALQVLERNETD